jgi:hypothetical protein
MDTYFPDDATLVPLREEAAEVLGIQP